MSWPGMVFMVLLGILAGAVLAFFRARVLKDVARYLLVGVVGFVAGQGLTWVRPLSLFEIGVVNILYGIVGVWVAAWVAARTRFT